MSFNVDAFRSALVFDGARPNLFEVLIDFPFYVEVGNAARATSRFFCKSASLPGSTVGTVTVPYFGREVKVAGNRTFPEWNVTIINDETFVIRNAFERWHRGINENQANLRDPRALNTSPVSPGVSYAVDMEVRHYSKLGGTPIKKYKFKGVFPSDIAAIDLDWGSNDTIEEFSVTLAYQYWTTTDNRATSPIARRA